MDLIFLIFIVAIFYMLNDLLKSINNKKNDSNEKQKIKKLNTQKEKKVLRTPTVNNNKKQKIKKLNTQKEKKVLRTPTVNNNEKQKIIRIPRQEEKNIKPPNKSIKPQSNYSDIKKSNKLTIEQIKECFKKLTPIDLTISQNGSIKFFSVIPIITFYKKRKDESKVCIIETRELVTGKYINFNFDEIISSQFHVERKIKTSSKKVVNCCYVCKKNITTTDLHFFEIFFDQFNTNIDPDDSKNYCWVCFSYSFDVSIPICIECELPIKKERFDLGYKTCIDCAKQKEDQYQLQKNKKY